MKIKKLLKEIKEKPISSSILFSLGVGTIVLCIYGIINGIRMKRLGNFVSGNNIDISAIILFGMFMIYPIILTLIHIASLFLVPKDDEWRKIVKRFEYITIVIGFLYTTIYMKFCGIMWDAEWYQQLYNTNKHQPIWTEGQFTFFLLCVIGAIGYFLLSFVKLEKMPPLIIVLSISAMYLGIAECVVWCIHIFSVDYWCCLFPFDCVIIAMKTVRYKIKEWNIMELELHHDHVYEGHPILNYFHKKLTHAAYWPTIAFVLVWPLMGIMLCILILFGQAPDVMIKAWTETAGWRLSQQTAPPNLPTDGHYLCTVAARGHSRIVKPLRIGERHGHLIVVNRQLCIANAFEQIIEEKTPLFHKWIRKFYDTYGFPIAKQIRTKGAADMVYFMMKPLEWLFLIVLYLCDAQPERRISVQYLPKRYKEDCDPVKEQIMVCEVKKNE